MALFFQTECQYLFNLNSFHIGASGRNVEVQTFPCLKYICDYLFLAR